MRFVLLASVWLLACSTDNRTVSTIESNCPSGGCSDAGARERACVPGARQACIGADLCRGTQVCTDDGQRLGECECAATAAGGASGAGGAALEALDGSAGSGTGATSTAGSGAGGAGGGSAGRGGAGSTGIAIAPDLPSSGPLFADAGPSAPASSAQSGIVGVGCGTDADCGGAPLFCIQPTSSVEFQTGAPQGGYCSARCTTNADCAAADEISGCNTNTGTCIALCLPGTSMMKCGDARAQACTPIGGTGVGACLPRCTSDAACGAGRFCDPGVSGLCVAAAPPGGAFGSVCDANEDCASQDCLQFANPNDPAASGGGFCTQGCTYGRDEGCGFDAQSGGLRRAYCLQPRFLDGDLGDLGACFPLCDTTQDCPQADNGWICRLFSDPAAEQVLGRLGQCLPAALFSAAP